MAGFLRPGRLVLAGMLLIPVRVAGEPAVATVVAASGPLDTSVTMYRAPDDWFGSHPSDARKPVPWLQGYALISETRDIDVPAGPAVIRFPGVSAGMLAESVVISGLPVGVREKNLDAQLLSPRNLYAGWFGRPVTLRRENAASGQTSEQPAVIRSGPDGAAIIQTAQGFEAMTCGPALDSIRYAGVPDGLFTVPTLSIATDAAAAAHARVRVTYLAWNYDWRADYVLKLASDLRHGVLSAWVTLASADTTAFAHTTAAVVAGRPDFSETRDQPGDEGTLAYHCFPRAQSPLPMVTPPRSLAVPAPMTATIVVTAMRKSVVALAENLGDLKLFRLPLATTIAARSQKQVALFDPRLVTLEVVDSAVLDQVGDQDGGQVAVRVVVRMRNRKADGLGLALPDGQVRVLVNRNDRDLIAGEGHMDDRAINDRAEIAFAPASQVTVRQDVTRYRQGAQARKISVRNANPFAIQFEGTFAQTPAMAIRNASLPLKSRDGHKVWAIRIPAHGQATLRYEINAS